MAKKKKIFAVDDSDELTEAQAFMKKWRKNKTPLTVHSINGKITKVETNDPEIIKAVKEKGLTEIE